MLIHLVLSYIKSKCHVCYDVIIAAYHYSFTAKFEFVGVKNNKNTKYRKK